jgi:hypothetical protein
VDSKEDDKGTVEVRLRFWRNRDPSGRGGHRESGVYLPDGFVWPAGTVYVPRQPHAPSTGERMVNHPFEYRQAFVCKYMNTPLTHTGGARDAEWEHAVPGDPESVVLVAAVVNRMKADLTEDQWDAMVRALYATRIEGKQFDEKAFPPNWQPKSTARGRRSPGDTPGTRPA